jgi:4-hydroxybutyrate dehydrogenase
MAYICYVTHIQFDQGAIDTLNAECERVGIHRPMIVTDKGVRAAGIVDKVNAAWGAQPTAIFDDISSIPTETAAQDGALLYRNEKCDGLIAVGGG